MDNMKMSNQVQVQDLIFYHEENKALQQRVKRLEEENCKKDTYLDGVMMSITTLTNRLNDMEGQLCHCSEGKGKRKDIIKMEVDDDKLVHESEEEGEYQPASVTPGPIMTKLIPIDQDPVMSSELGGCQKVTRINLRPSENTVSAQYLWLQNFVKL